MKRVLLLFAACLMLSCSEPPLRVTCSKAELLANGYDVSQLKVYGARKLPLVSLSGAHPGVRLSGPIWKLDHWESEVQTGVLPGTLIIRVQSGSRHIEQAIAMTLEKTDSAADGTPDYLRLDEESDRKSFRRYFTYAAEVQYFLPAELRAAQVTDCSSLVRYSYIEALRNHIANSALSSFPLAAPLPSVRKYSYPYSPLGPAVFRIKTGTYLESDAAGGVFSEFADVQKLWRYNTFFVSRNIMLAQAGDILFYRREGQHGLTFHSMIFLGRSQLRPDDCLYVIYHTGPDGANTGEIRRLTVSQLLHFPNPQWQALAANPLFLGVYRWNILKVVS